MSSMLSRLFGGGTPHITVDELAALIADRSRPSIVDVREPQEFRSGHLPGARNIPLGSLPARAGKDLRAGSTVYVICQSGARSRRGAKTLAAMGFQAINVSGGTGAWTAHGHRFG